MGNFIDTFEMPTAIADNTKLDLSCKHITTANWMQLNPIYSRELVPGEKLEVGVESFTRLNPLVVPTFAPGSKLKISRFFVPYRTVFRGWNDFITDSMHVGADGKQMGLVNKVPFFTNATLLNAMVTAFTDHASSPMGYGDTFAVSASTSADTTTPVDYRDEQGTGYLFTTLGRQALKVLNSLGYRFNPNHLDETQYNALPLLCFAKVYADYYWPSQYMGSYLHQYLESMFNYDVDFPHEFTAEEIAKILRYTIFVCYDSDYFVSAFDNPVSPASTNYSTISIPDVSFPYGYNQTTNMFGRSIGNFRVTNGADGINTGTSREYGTAHAAMSDFNAGAAQIGVTATEYVHEALHRLTDYMKRHQLAGSRAMERYLARYGKALSAEKLNRSVYLGSDITTIQIGDVMSTSDTVQGSGSATTGQQLGAYAGKGIAYGKNDYDGFSTDEYGMYIITSSLVPDVFYDQGIDANIYHLSKTDFWVPEFDFGMRAISASELIVPTDGQSSYAASGIHTTVFGFTPRYSEYRVPKSRLTGSFRIPTLNQNSEFGSDSWHMMREFADQSFGHSLTGITHSPSFTYGVADAGQYNRIFFNSDFNAPDQFVTIFSFDVKSYAPYASLYDTYEWDDEQTGRKISMQSNGVKVN